MAATGPKVVTDPVELLTPDPSRLEPYINKFWGPLLCATMGVAAVCFGNYSSARPVFSGIQKHVAAVGVGAYIGKVFEGYRADYLAERDAILRHYIQLHPDDFQVPERKKYAEVLDRWVPIR